MSFDKNFPVSVSCLMSGVASADAAVGPCSGPDLIRIPPFSDKPEKPIWRGELISKYT